ncbi:hypothetical protein IFM89_027920, partial [Coptis chinensis]
ATDDQITDTSEAFYIGQSVRGEGLNVDSETGKITLFEAVILLFDRCLFQAYFLWEEKIAKLQLSDSERYDYKWLESLSVGNVVEGKVHEAKEFGVVLSFKEHNDVFGFISHYQLGGTTLETGSIVQAVVLDIAKGERLVDLSLKPDLVSRFKDQLKYPTQKKVLETQKGLVFEPGDASDCKCDC